MDIAPANDANAAAPRAGVEEMGCSPDASVVVALEVSAGTGEGLLPTKLRNELWRRAGAELAGLSEGEFGTALEEIGAKHNFGLERGSHAGSRERETFWRGLHLEDLALALGCARGVEAAWRRFMALFQAPVTHAAVGMTRSATLGEELASALYAELFGVRECDGARRSPLEKYSGRGSLMGWLRAILAQRQVDWYRRTRRETELEDLEPAAPETAGPNATGPEPGTIANLRMGLEAVLRGLSAEERFLLSAYYLDGHTLAEISRVLGVHEATVSRKLKRATEQVRKGLLRALVARGLSRRAAEEALGTDPRDVEINLRKLLQSPDSQPYPVREGGA
ncbi:MAG TPA: sigma-70 family RNA polymerase sigma factor [Terracidiphilus sp.]|nr:sigma-70 family RNA polymerase sigma factor [Terracidiphilus sp.]